MSHHSAHQNIGYNFPSMPYHGSQIPLQQQYQPPQPTKLAPAVEAPAPDPVTVNSDYDPPRYSFEDRFVIQKQKYNDLWAAILFLVDLLGLIIVSVISLRTYSRSSRFSNGGVYGDGQKDFGLSTNTFTLLIIVVGVAFVCSYAYFLAARAWTKKIIYITAVLNIGLGIGTATYYFIRQRYAAAVIFLLFALFYAYCFWTWKHKIKFAVLMLQTSFDVAKHYGHVYIVSALGGAVAVILGVWVLVALIAVNVRYAPTGADKLSCRTGRGNANCSTGNFIGLVFFVTFSGYWISEVVKNVIHVSISGVYGSWYFCSRSPQGMPSHPTLGAFKRAMTSSLGSISLGSLIVSIIQLLRQLYSVVQRNPGSDDCSATCAVFCCLGYILGIIESLVEFFNVQYAYSYIALYGKAYIASAKETWKMMKDRGLDVIVQDCLVDPVLSMASVLVGILCTFIAYIYLVFTAPAYNSTGGMTPIIMAFTFLVGLQICNTFLIPLKSGVATIFTSMAHNPEILLRDFPELYHQILAVYPHLSQAIHS